MLKRIDECDLKRENADARLGLLADGSENVIPVDHRSSVNFTVRRLRGSSPRSR